MALPHYKKRVFAGRSGNGWCYQIINQDGDVIVEGARVGTKADVSQYLDKTIKRLNNHGSTAISAVYQTKRQ